MIIDFPHKQQSHCENGALCNLLAFKGFEISEPLIFGIGSGLFFAYMPFITNKKIPLTSFRVLPGQIQKKALKRLGIKYVLKKYKSKHQAMADLDTLLMKGQAVGLLTNLYYLPFFPKSYRFHYNQHNTIIHGVDQKTYYVSDPILEKQSVISYDDLLRARFAKGVLSISGNLYYPDQIPENIDLQNAIIKGIRATCRLMVKNPIPYHGVKGIKLLNKRIRKEQRKGDVEFLNIFLGNIIRMQEEAGTGGAGFRYMYGAFLEEVSGLLNNHAFKEFSVEITNIGHLWREFAICASRLIKNRGNRALLLDNIDILLNDIALKEKIFFKKLYQTTY